jgi:hypothetical protein
LASEVPGAGPGCVRTIDVRGAMSHPFFRDEDLKAVVTALTGVAQDPVQARREAAELRERVGRYTWSACVEQAAEAFAWRIQKGSIHEFVQDAGSTVVAAEGPAPTRAAVPPIVAESPAPSPLSMPGAVWQPGGTVAESQLLRAEEELVPFDPARKPDLDAQHAWLDDPQWPQAVRLITGAGGLGKTRLALELCRQRLGAGWHAGLLDPSIEPNGITVAWRDLLGFKQPLLIVIDYAETRQAVLLALVKRMLQSPPNRGQTVRVLLLARDAAEWWDRLPSKDSLCEPFLNGYATSGPVRLPALHEAVVDRNGAYQRALHAFAEKLGVAAPKVIPDLERNTLAVRCICRWRHSWHCTGSPTTAEGLTKALLNHEVRYWRGLLAPFGWAEPERLAAQLLALATLAGGFATPREARPYWETATASSLARSDFETLFHTLAPLYPGRQGLQAVRPDLLGEALVAQALLRGEGTSLLDAVLAPHASQGVRRHTLTVLSRLSSQRLDLHEVLVEALVRHAGQCLQDAAVVATETPGDLPRLAQQAFARLARAIKSRVAGLLSPLLREESVQLSELACVVWEYLVGKTGHKQSRKALSAASNREYAKVLTNYAIALARAGYCDPALEHARQALEILRRLAQTRPDRYEPDYAGSLGNYAAHLREVGQGELGLEHARES